MVNNTKQEQYNKHPHKRTVKWIKNLQAEICHFRHLVPVVQRVDNFIQWINCYPADKCTSTKAFGKFFTQSHSKIREDASTLNKNYRVIRIFLSENFICPIPTYPVDKIIPSLNNWGLLYKNLTINI